MKCPVIELLSLVSWFIQIHFAKYRDPMIDSIFAFESTRARQRNAPLFVEREEFLCSMMLQGTSKQRLRSLAAMLLHIVRIMNLQTLRVVELSEIEEAALVWVADTQFNNRNGQTKSTSLYVYAATKWLGFHGRVRATSSRIEPDDSYREQFVDYLTNVKGLSPGTIRSTQQRVRAFMKWNTEHQRPLARVTLKEIDEYLLAKTRTGYLPRSIASVCSALRLFFTFAEARKWNTTKIATAIHSPRIPRYESEPKGPIWQDVRRMLDHDFGTRPADLRAAAVLSLCAVYGLRNSEIIRLKLSDFDWLNEILTVRRAKSGKIQQFPIQREVGDKVIEYLKSARPRCGCRHLFLSLRPPYRRLNDGALWVVVAKRMKSLEIPSRNFGPHALRHACATHLLHEGSSLPEIAQFLGHSDLKSVGVYAKHDIQALKDVADFSLAALL